MYLRRHCYDKPWRCPGWAGGGWRYPRVQRCDGGSLDYFQEARYGWEDWRFNRCPKCDVLVVPHVTRWLDPTYLWFRVRRLPGTVRDRLEVRRWRRERRRERERGGMRP